LFLFIIYKCTFVKIYLVNFAIDICTNSDLITVLFTVTSTQTKIKQKKIISTVKRSILFYSIFIDSRSLTENTFYKRQNSSKRAQGILIKEKMKTAVEKKIRRKKDQFYP
jgi:thioredoxin reductase